MIVNVRGTFGAGKSTIVRKVMELYATREPAMVEGRKRPYGYTCIAEGHPNLWVVGHYETKCGGADTISRIDDIYGQVENAAKLDYDVIFEGGALVQHDVRRTAAMSERFPMRVVSLYLPIEISVQSVRQRRLDRGDDRPFDPKNVLKMHTDMSRSDKRLLALGVDVRKPETREDALSLVLEALRWS